MAHLFSVELSRDLLRKLCRSHDQNVMSCDIPQLMVLREGRCVESLQPTFSRPGIMIGVNVYRTTYRGGVYSREIFSRNLNFAERLVFRQNKHYCLQIFADG